MKQVRKILVPTDLSEQSRRGFCYACSLAAEIKAGLVVLHIASEFKAWELFSDDFGFLDPALRTWPIDRVLAEASLDLNRFLEPHLHLTKDVPTLTKRVVLGSIPDQISSFAGAERADLIVMSPRRHRGVKNFLNRSITDRVSRMSPCPVLCVNSPLPSPQWRGRTTFPAFFGWSAARPATPS
jgi:nucleotide-binding universal stress UspA family protein